MFLDMLMRDYGDLAHCIKFIMKHDKTKWQKTCPTIEKQQLGRKINKRTRRRLYLPYFLDMTLQECYQTWITSPISLQMKFRNDVRSVCIQIFYCQPIYITFDHLQFSMRSLFDKMSNQPRLKHYAIYTVTYLAYGILLVSLGPLIPFLAEQNNLKQTEYSFLFTCRAVGMLLGSLIMNYYQSKEDRPNIHQFLALSSVLIVITNLFFMWSATPFYQGLWVFIGSIAYFLLEISINLSIIVISTKENLEFWLMFINGVISIGGIISPIIVSLIHINAYFVISGIIGVIAPLYLLLPSPETFKKQQTELSSLSVVASVRVERLLCLMMFIFLGAIVSQSVWSASYAVITGIQDKNDATIFLTIFYLVSTVSRFAIALLKIKTSQKLKLSISGIVIFEVLTVVVLWSGFAKPALLINSLGMGASLSSIYPLLFSVSSQFNQPLTERQASSIAIWGVIGEGALSPICAKLMQFIHPDMYFFFIMGLGVIMELARRHVMTKFQDLRKQHSGIELAMLDPNILKTDL